MNSSRSSSLVALLLALVLAVGAAGAVSVGQADTPSEGAVGSDVAASVVLEELFQNPSLEQWTLRGETELGNVTWTVEVVNQAGTEIAQSSYVEATFEHPITIDSGAAEVTVSVTGTVPPIDEYTYDPAEAFLVADLKLVREGGTTEDIQTYEARHFTESSREARQAIDAAQAAIDEAGGHEEAERTLQSAISAYENENFDNAVNLANQAEEEAGQARASQQRTQLILAAVGALVVVGLIVGAFLYWRRTRTQSRL